MSLSCSDCFSDLLCGEDSSIILSGVGDASPYSSDLESRPNDLQESIAGLLEDERDLSETNSRIIFQPIDASGRAESIAWILKVQRYYGFLPLTAYLSVTYFDRFLCSRQLPKMNGWPLQLLSVACLSLAAKMEEPLVPSLLNLQVEGAKFIFEPRNVSRMELLVMRALEWRLRSISPLYYLNFFAVKVDLTGTYTGLLNSRATEIILSAIQETSMLEYRPSCIAAAAILFAANDIPNFSLINAQHAESWSDGLHREDIMNCYQLIRQNIDFKSKPKMQPKVLPQLRVTTLASFTSSDSSSSSSSSLSSPSSYKRRKLNNSSWADDDKDKF